MSFPEHELYNTLTFTYKIRLSTDRKKSESENVFTLSAH